MTKKMKEKVHNSVESSSNISQVSSLDSVNRNISSVFSQFPRDIQDFTCNLSLEEKEALAYMMKWHDREYKKCKKSSNSNPHDPSFNCNCSACNSTFLEIWFDSENHDHMTLLYKCAVDHKNSKNEKEGEKSEHGSSGNGELVSQSGGGDVIQQTTSETTMVGCSEGGGRGSHRTNSRILFPDVLGVSNSRLWRLWYPVDRDEEEETTTKY